MKMRHSTTLLLAILLSTSTNAVSQKETSLIENIEQVVKVKQPEFNLKRKFPFERGAFAHWTSSEDEVFVTIQELGSSKEAYTQMRHAAELIAVGSAKRLRNLGDEANIWENDSNAGHAAIHLRRGNLLVFVKASSSDVARQFAHHVSDQIVVGSSGKLSLKLY